MNCSAKPACSSTKPSIIIKDKHAIARMSTHIQHGSKVYSCRSTASPNLTTRVRPPAYCWGAHVDHVTHSQADPEHPELTILQLARLAPDVSATAHMWAVCITTSM